MIRRAAKRTRNLTIGKTAEKEKHCVSCPIFEITFLTLPPVEDLNHFFNAQHD
jgi:hypothetical protein